MLRIPRISSRRAALTALVAGSAAALFGALPSRGQQPAAQPSVQVTLPATANLGRTRIDYSLTLPTGLTLQDWPAVRVVDSTGKLVEYARMMILQRAPRLTGFHRLWTKSYPPGAYRVTVEVAYQRPDGTAAQYISPAATLTVPG